MTDRESVDRARAAREARGSVAGRPLSSNMARTGDALRRYLTAEARWLRSHRRRTEERPDRDETA